eukprot:966328-Rhodomonas_salina.1
MAFSSDGKSRLCSSGDYYADWLIIRATATSNSGLTRLGVHGVTRWMTTSMTRGCMVIRGGSMLIFV